MKLIVLALATAVAAISGGFALAREKPGADWLPAQQVKQRLMAAGYTEITELEVDDEHWDGKGVKNGQKMKFDADPKTGAILGEMPDN